MKIEICDRCGMRIPDELEPDDCVITIGDLWSKRGKHRYHTYGTFCPECSESFLEWLNDVC